MIARLWHGWTSFDNADAYEALLRTEILPGIHRVEGYRGAYLWRREVEASAILIGLPGPIGYRVKELIGQKSTA